MVLKAGGAEFSTELSPECVEVEVVVMVGLLADSQDVADLGLVVDSI